MTENNVYESLRNRLQNEEDPNERRGVWIHPGIWSDRTQAIDVVEGFDLQDAKKLLEKKDHDIVMIENLSNNYCHLVCKNTDDLNYLFEFLKGKNIAVINLLMDSDYGYPSIYFGSNMERLIELLLELHRTNENNQ